MRLLLLLVLLVSTACTHDARPFKKESAKQGQIKEIPNGIEIWPSQTQSSMAQAIRIQFYRPDIVRVSAQPSASFGDLNNTLMLASEPESVKVKVEREQSQISLSSSQVKVVVQRDSGRVSFFDSDGKPILKESPTRQFGAVIDDPGQVDSNSYSITQRFDTGPDEAFYGLGQQQNGLVNYAGHDVEMTTYNMEISIPLVVSSENYGLLWNNTSVSRFGNPEPAAALNQGFDLFDQDGKAGALTVSYYDGKKLLLKRREADTNYQFLKQGSTREFPLPPEAEAAENLRVVINGRIQAKASGTHTLKMYSSGYAKLYLDNDLKLDRWRMNWNPWFHDVDIELDQGESRQLTLEWLPGGGYLRLMQSAPQAVEDETKLTLSSDSAKAIDYFYIAGSNKDEIVAGYRALTGKAVLLPKWAYGFWQSRERYKSQDEILDNLKEYRKRQIPLDNIVLDWSYWPEDAWGSHQFDSQHFPNPKAMVDKVHELNANIMISVWPKFYPSTEHYKQLDQQGFMFNKNIEQKNLDWIGPGYLNAFYDAFSPDATAIFWQQLNETINPLGFDAWWLDAVEPDIHSNLSFRHRKDLMSPNALGTGAEYFNAYALPHAEAVYQGDRASDPDQRVFILTRSGFAGIQRTASAIWSGDIVSRWSNLKEQIAAGIGVGMAGMPNWTFDIGGFTPEDRYRSNKGEFVGPWNQMDPAQRAEWQELNTRWFQFGAFVPLFRAHGQNPYREIFNIADEGSPTYDTIKHYIQLRYRLMPYIYSEAGKMYWQDATLMRGLAMDFADDTAVRNINDQYMFGPSLLINPVYEYKARSRSVYLPKGQPWYDFYSGQSYAGGQSIIANAPYNRMPIFVKAGSIIPTGPDLQYTSEKPLDPLTITVYTGANGHYELYEDDGDSYKYEQGERSVIAFNYDDKEGVLTIAKRVGQYQGMLDQRTIRIRWIEGERKGADNFNDVYDQEFIYDGKAISIKKP